MRVFLIIIALFILPFAGYYLWRGIKAAGASAPSESGEPGEAGGLPPKPIRTLALLGLVFVIVGMIGLGFSGVLSGGGDGQFRPPRMEDGRMIPGGIDRDGD